MRRAGLAALAALVLSPVPGIAGGAGDALRYELDGVSDDLLGAGLGPSGLRGPLEGAAGIAGVEILAPLRSANGAVTTVMLQIPRAFDLRRACLVVAASSGSRGIYGALPTAGEWGLKRGCAVVHTDKGTGMGLYDVDRGTGLRIDGTVCADPTGPLIGAAVAVSVIAALTGSASGGQSIALPLIAPHYLDQGVDPEALHRVVAISSGGLDSLPHNGYVVTTLRAICRETYAAAYPAVAAMTVIVPVIGVFVALLLL